MLNVSQAIKDAFANPSSGKTLIVYFPDLDITVDSSTIYSESFKLTEVIMDTNSIEFVGCLPSKMQVQIQDFGENVKGERVQVSIQVDTGTTQEDPVPVFDGIVDSVTQQSNKRIKELVAYDELYTKGNTDIAQWYVYQFTHDWQDGTTLKDFRDELFEYLEIEVEPTTLVNDDLEFVKQYSPVNLKALDVIKYLCQINGVFGIINRSGKFEYRPLTPMTGTSYPVVEVPEYKQIDYQEFTVNPVDKLTIRQTDSEEGISVGSGSNNYIIQGNFFTQNLTDEELLPIAERLYPLIFDISYIPYKVTQVGYPWVECGDIVEYEVYDFEASQTQHQDVYKPMQFYIFERYLTGIQALRDEYEAQGEEYQTVFITNLDVQIETIKQQIENIQGKLKTMNLNYVTFYNEEDVDVADGETKVIASADFAVSETCQLRIDMEYLLECETTESIVNNIINNDDLRVTLYYEYDSHILDIREPKETYQDGKHIIHTYYVLDVKNTQPHTWKVYMECDGGSVHIDMLQAQNTMLGLGTIKSDYWDGTIKLTDTVNPIPVGMDDVSISQISDAVTVVLIPPIRIELSDTVNAVEVNSTEVSVAQITDELDAELNP